MDEAPRPGLFPSSSAPQPRDVVVPDFTSDTYAPFLGTITGDIAATANMLTVWLPVGTSFVIRGGYVLAVCYTALAGVFPVAFLTLYDGPGVDHPIIPLGFYHPLTTISGEVISGTHVTSTARPSAVPWRFDLGKGYRSMAKANPIYLGGTAGIGAGIILVQGMLWGGAGLMPVQTFHFGPLQGLSVKGMAEEAGLQGTFMRSGYNVEVIDNEWWVRNGLGDISGSFGTIPLKWAIQGMFGSDSYYLCGPSHVFIVSPRYESQPGITTHRGSALNGLFTGAAGTVVFREPLYPTACEGTFDFVQGERIFAINTITSGGLGPEGQFFIHNPIGSADAKVYRIAVLIPLTLDRPWEDPTNTVNLDIFDPALPCLATGEGGTPEEDCCGGVVLFEQNTAYATNTLGYNNDAAAVGIYVVLVSSQGIAAVPVANTGTTPVIRSFVRQTQLAAPTMLDTPSALKAEVYKDRLFVATEATEGQGDDRTVAYSRPFDLMQWHTGLQDLGGTFNFITFSGPEDPITGLGILGDGLVIHRRESQEVMQVYGNGFRSYRSRTGFGVWPKGQFVQTPQGHIGWSRYGPVLLSSDGMAIMFPDIERMLQALFIANQELIGCHATIHDANRRLVYFVLGFELIGRSVDAGAPWPLAFGEKLIVRHQDAEEAHPQTALANYDGYDYYSRSPVFVVDYARSTAWLEDMPGISGGGSLGGQLYLFRYDGCVLSHPTGYSGKDYVVNRSNDKVVVDAMVETQWMEHGSANRKSITKLYVTLRALDTGDVAEVAGFKFNPQRVSDLWDTTDDTLHLCTIEILADQDDDYVRSTADVNILVSEMLARTLDGTRQLPLLQFDIPVRASGRSFKYRLRNALSAAATAAGHKQGHFRLVDMVAEMTVESGTTAARFTGDKP